MTSEQRATHVSIGDFQLDCRSGELTKGKKKIRLQPQPAKLLLLLTTRAGEVVTRAEIQRVLWGDDTFVDFEHGINFSIKQIRAALGDEAETARYIETVPRVGYRFVGRTETLSTSPKDARGKWDWLSFRRWLLPAIALLAVTGLSLVLNRKPEPTPAMTTRLIQLTSQAGIEAFPSLSPDGDQFVFVGGDRTGNRDIYLQRVTGQKAINLTEDSPERDWQPAFSPDGRRIAFRSEREGGGLFVMGATGESVKRVTDAGFNPSWSPDGEFLVYSTLGIYDPSRDPRWGELRVAQVATGEVRAIEIVGDAVQPSWSPHGSRIAFWSHSLSESNHRDVWTVPAGGGEIVPVTSDEHVDWNPVWSPDGEFLYFSSNRGGSSSLWRISIDEKTGVTKGAPLLVTTSDAARIQQITIARDGRRIAYQSDLVNSNLYKIAFDPESESVAGEPVAIVTGSRSVVHPDASPDGRSVAFSFFMNGGQADLAVVASDGTGLRQLTEEPHFSNFQPRWSRDGSEIVFVSSRSGNNELWSIRPDGGNLRHLTQTRSRVMNPVWSPDGRRVSYWMGENYYFLDPALSWNQQTPEKLPEPPEGRFEATDWSPDGNRLVGYVTYPSRKSRIAVFSIDSQEYEILPIEGGSPYWLSDGRRLIFNVGEALVLLDVTTDRRKEILKREGLNADDGSLSISPDDRTIYFLIDRWEADIWMVQMEDSSLP